MCNLGQASIALQTAGAGAGVAGAFGAAKGQQTALKSQAATATINAQMAEDGAQAALLAGQRQEQAIDISTSSLKATQRADFGANGIDVNGGGTPVRVADSTDVLGQIDANTTHANAIRTAFGYKTQETNDLNAARIAKADAGAISPWAAAGTSLLSSAGSVAKSYYSLSKSGALSNSAITPVGSSSEGYDYTEDDDLWDR